MKYQVIEDAEILIPNSEHKNFTDSGKIIEAESIIEGNPVEISGLRKGEPFTYKMFNTKNNQLIYIKKVKPMEKTEVTLGFEGAADTTKATTIKFPSTKLVTTTRVIGTVAGAGAGFWFSKHHKHSHTKTAVFVVLGALLGYGAGVLVEENSGIKIAK